MVENGVLMQYFEWFLPNDGNLWQRLAEDAPHLAQIGVTSVWIPPVCKGQNNNDVGYGVYDLYDLGEFDQKGTIRTKYGSRDDLCSAMEALRTCGIDVYVDVVLNHKAGADHTEKCHAIRVDSEDRNNEIEDVREIECWVGFDFVGRGDTYSPFKWHWWHFSGVDYDVATGETGVFRIVGDGKGWSQGVDNEFGNYDYLMFADIDVDNPEVSDELCRWGRWLIDTLQPAGMRLDAVKHIDIVFMQHFVDEMRSYVGNDFYFVAEYWNDDVDTLSSYLHEMNGKVDLFDVALHYNLHRASLNGDEFDLRNLLEGSLVERSDNHAVTFVDNHDSQPGCALESTVADWFKPAAYALILLMKRGYPCVFYGDYYGIGGEKSMHRDIIDVLLNIRKERAWGEETLYFDNRTDIGFVRHGDDSHENSGVAVIISSCGNDGAKQMNVGLEHKGETWIEVTGSLNDEIVIDNDGNGLFGFKGGKVAVWIKRVDNET